MTSRVVGAFSLVLILAGCSGGGGEPNARDVAAAWLEAAVNGDQATMDELTDPGKDLDRIAGRISEMVSSTSGVSWQTTIPGKGDEALTANLKGNIITIELKKQGDGSYLVIEVDTSS